MLPREVGGERWSRLSPSLNRRDRGRAGSGTGAGAAAAQQEILRTRTRGIARGIYKSFWPWPSNTPWAQTSMYANGNQNFLHGNQQHYNSIKPKREENQFCRVSLHPKWKKAHFFFPSLPILPYRGVSSQHSKPQRSFPLAFRELGGCSTRSQRTLPPRWPLLTLFSSSLGLAHPRDTGQHQGLITRWRDPTTTACTGCSRVPPSAWLTVPTETYRAEERSGLRAPGLSTADLWLSFAIKIQPMKR